jgi:mRNA interferase RelE/StbE
VSQFSIRFLRRARKDLEKIPTKTQDRILKAIQNLGADPYPSGSKKLEGSSDSFRIRVGDYRVIYEIKKKEIYILIVRIGHRKDVYKP